MIWAWTIAVVLLMIGVRTIIAGLRGVVVDDHPICRGCGFDLVGLSEPTTCPECGRDVRIEGAVRIGARRVRRGRVIQGVGLLVCAFGLGAIGWNSITGTNWNRYKPNWMLMAEAGGGLGAGDRGVLYELVARMESGSLDRDSSLTLVRRALALQADRTRPWIGAWGDVIGEAYTKGLLKGGEGEQFLRGIWEIEFRARSRVRAGVPTNIEGVWRSPARGMAFRRGGLALPYDAECRSPRMRCDLMQDGRVVATRPFYPTNPLIRNWDAAAMLSGCGSLRVRWEVAPGKYTMRCEAEIPVRFAGARPARELWVEASAVLPIEITSADEPTVTLRPDQTIANAIADNLRLMIKWSEARNRAEVSWQAKSPPSNTFMRVYVRERDGIRAGRITGSDEREASVSIGGYAATVEFRKTIHAERVDVAFVPSLLAAEGRPDVVEVWDGAVVYEDMPLQEEANLVRMRPTRVVSPAPKNVEDLFKKD